MIKTAQLKMTDPALSLALGIIGQGRMSGNLKEGLVQISHFSPERVYDVKNNWDYDFNFSLSGVADTSDQVLEYAANNLKNDNRDWCVFVTHIQKDISNRGRGGGWRWRKWGEYIGSGTPKQEYLDDEEEFKDGVYVFSIHEIN